MILSWNITKACNLSCRHCYRDAGLRDPHELSTDEGKDLILEIAAAGFKVLILSGGEPILRKDILELISFACTSGLRPVLGTNGTLIDTSTARDMRLAGLGRAGISVDSMDADVHDDFRKMKGSWKRTMDGIEACRKEGLDFQVHTTVTRRNLAGISGITEFAEQSGAKAHHIFFLVPTGRGNEIGDTSLSRREYHSLVASLAQSQKNCGIELKTVCAPQFAAFSISNNIDTRFKKGCLAGISYCCILPNGDVHPCPYMPIKAGNVRDIQFSRIWKENALFAELRTQRYKGRCGRCSYRFSCGGCRARAFHDSGDYMNEDPFCDFQGEINAYKDR
jgi:putative heme d1 biosynthesis radical SAM protein NirJ2